MIYVPLTQLHQFTVLKDILSNHQSDCCGSISECEQVERLVKSLLAQGIDQEHIVPVLNEIYQYGQNGKYSSDLDNHITTHQTQLTGWIDNINSLF